MMQFEVTSLVPVLCPGCPLRGFFYIMSQNKDLIVYGDIGSKSPFDAPASMPCIDSDFPAGIDLSKVLAEMGNAKKKAFVVVKDSAFFHSCFADAEKIICNNLIPVVMDNSITGFSEHQDKPGTGCILQGESSEKHSIENILMSAGYQKLISTDPQDLTAMRNAVDDALESEVPTAIITRRPCILIEGIEHDIGLCEVDPYRCLGCKKCLRVACPALCMKDGKSKIDPNLCAGCTVCAQICPVDAISKRKKQHG